MKNVFVINVNSLSLMTIVTIHIVPVLAKPPKVYTTVSFIQKITIIMNKTFFLAMIGILNGNLAIWVIFVVCYTLLVVGLSFKIYFLNYVIDGLEQFKNCINDHGFCFESLKPIRKSKESYD